MDRYKYDRFLYTGKHRIGTQIKVNAKIYILVRNNEFTYNG